ncbi:MAG: sulfatase [Gemmatimonadaceae bacterium]|nr:sulfatase [Gemmatimonadaceae bacterium]
MKRHPWYRAANVGTFVLLCLLTTGSRSAATAPAEHPNVLLIVIDDMGWKDTGVYGSDFYETPNIDRLASQGARFAQFYTAGSVCSPTRASIMTGKSPARVHITDWIGGDDRGKLLPAAYERELPLSEFSIGEAFQAGGYDTGYIGKWHLGQLEASGPAHQGFAFTRAVNHAGQPGSHFAPYKSASRTDTDVPDLEGDAPRTYLTDRLTTEAVQFIRTSRTKPFFLVLSHYAVHTPLEAKTELAAKYAAKRDARGSSALPALQAEGPTSMTKMQQDHATYAAMVESVDASVGVLMHALDSLDMAKNTIVVFMSDNGGLSTLLGSASRIPTSNAPLRAGKGWLYEGGIRAPFLVRWPGGVPAKRVINTPTISTDVYPTLLELAGLPALRTQTLDGVSVAPLLTGKGSVSSRSLFWHFPHYHDSGSTPSGAIRSGSLKLIEWFESGEVELYDLARDPGEHHDVSKERPRDAATLRAQLATWRIRVDANMPQRALR